MRNQYLSEMCHTHNFFANLHVRFAYLFFLFASLVAVNVAIVSKETGAASVGN